MNERKWTTTVRRRIHSWKQHARRGDHRPHPFLCSDIEAITNINADITDATAIRSKKRVGIFNKHAGPYEIIMDEVKDHILKACRSASSRWKHTAKTFPVLSPAVKLGIKPCAASKIAVLNRTLV